MEQLISENFTIEIGSIENGSFESLLAGKYANSNIVIIVDENSHDNCLEYMLTTFTRLQDAEVMLLPVGEENKVLEVCFQVWESLTEYNIGRKDLVINLGGGVVTDMGGFIASVYKRGVDFINIPTTLLAMVDASIGGKTGVDLGIHKNQLGVFQHPKAIYVDPIFLDTLPSNELMNGYAEMLKHALIRNPEEWERLSQLEHIDLVIDLGLISNSIRVKFDVIEADPFEQGVRKILNFGHTIGHGIEGYLLEKSPIGHGHAVALGMVAESYIAMKKGLLSKAIQSDVQRVILSKFPTVFLDDDAMESVVQLTLHDKKNFNQSIQMALIDSIGSCQYDVVVSEQEVLEALIYLNQFVQLN